MRDKCYRTKKVVYGTQWDADQSLKGLRRKSRDNYATRSYWCEYCGGFHLTSQEEKTFESGLIYANRFEKFLGASDDNSDAA